jgi:hypothetical protein
MRSQVSQQALLGQHASLPEPIDALAHLDEDSAVGDQAGKVIFVGLRDAHSVSPPQEWLVPRRGSSCSWGRGGCDWVCGVWRGGTGVSLWPLVWGTPSQTHPRRMER